MIRKYKKTKIKKKNWVLANLWLGRTAKQGHNLISSNKITGTGFVSTPHLTAK
jgi:hypothetical protein